MEPGTPSWIFDANAAAARALVAAVTAGEGERLGALWRELQLEEHIDDFYRCVSECLCVALLIGAGWGSCSWSRALPLLMCNTPPLAARRCEAAGQLLILAAQLGKAAVLKPLLTLGASLDAVDEHGHQGPALLHAASAGNVNVVRALLEVRAGTCAGVRAAAACLLWPASLAACCGPALQPCCCADAAAACPRAAAPQAGASPDQQDVRGQSALIVAVLADRAAVAEVLLSAGADPNRADSFGATPLWYCGQFNALDCIPGGGLGVVAVWWVSDAPCGRLQVAGCRLLASPAGPWRCARHASKAHLLLPRPAPPAIAYCLQCWACTARTRSTWTHRRRTTPLRCAG